MTAEQFERLLEVLEQPDWFEITVNVLAIFTAVWVAIYTVCETRKDNMKQLAFDRRLDVYAELGNYLQQVTADHNKAIKLRSEISGLITKAYFFASEPINNLFHEFLTDGIYDDEVELINQFGEERSTDFNIFDAYIWTLIDSMKFEALKGGDITREEIEKIKKKEFQDIGNDYIHQEME